ncbi:pantoate--beta-alanine ligase [Hoylesella nanceiensis]|jgi:pantoate--beta-alanine ligase|uniref:pantoate--beta-alanine ligase n=1 Tax=Hoylesella nanceiensis TaxID=425941 RepID=UPI0028EF6970|nr:pantoate--beta-alanine ligase [Hoylesella nanceiensis]
MKIFDNIVDLQNELFYLRKANKKIGLVPTMGALHQGHASLVKQCVADNDITIVSVFLNPTQFNDPKDLERYPRTFEEDCKILNEVGADIVFAPSPKEMYPTPDNRHFEFPPTSTVMEGAKRPGHFNGVCQVVSRLFYITKPHNAYFGEKDWQQICVIKQLVKYLNLDINIIECPIIREESGLAMSSRNALLTSEERAIAANIYRILKESVTKKDSLSVGELQQEVINSINAIDQLEVEYFEIVDGNTLETVHSWNDSPYIVGCITVYCGATPIRLIDHIKYK